MTVTLRQREAAEQSVGWSLSDTEVEDALESVGNTSTDLLKQQLELLVRQFDAQAGRGPEIADEIDTLRIAIAAREAVTDG